MNLLGAAGGGSAGQEWAALAVGETVILPTSPLHPY